MLKRLTWLCATLLLASCTGFKLGIANLPARFGNFDRQAALAYGTGPRRLLDVYVPRGAKGAPVVVFWYGGGFVAGRREQYRFVGAALAQQGMVAFLPDYRVYPDAVFPEFVKDAALAVKWVRDHAADYGGDPDKIFLMGHSAGGYLASLVALDRRYLTEAGAADLRVRGFIALSTPHVLAPNTPMLNTIFGPPWKPADWQPVEFAAAGSPPALLIHGADDSRVVRRHSELLAAALSSQGVDVKLLLLQGIGHPDTVAALSVPLRSRAPVLAETVAFVQRWSAN